MLCKCSLLDFKWCPSLTCQKKNKCFLCKQFYIKRSALQNIKVGFWILDQPSVSHTYSSKIKEGRDEKKQLKSRKLRNLLKMLLKFSTIFLGPSPTSQLYSSSKTCMMLINGTKEMNKLSSETRFDASDGLTTETWSTKQNGQNFFFDDFI